MMKHTKTLIFISLIVIALIVWSCVDEISDDIPPVYDNDSTLIVDGWEFYKSGEYDSALTRFQSVNDRNAQATEAYIGKGWSNFRLGYYIPATTEFNVVLNLASEFDDDASMADAYAGLFLIELAIRYELETDPEQDPTEEELVGMMLLALDIGESALTYDPDYSTNHDPDYSYIEIHEALAHSYLYLHRFEEALGHAEAIYGTTLLADGGISTEEISVELVVALSEEGDRSLTFTGGYCSDDSLTWLGQDSCEAHLGVWSLHENAVRITDIQDANQDYLSVHSDIKDYLYEDDVINLASDYYYPTLTETVVCYMVSHAQPEQPSQFWYVLYLGNKGLYNIESISELKTEPVLIWWRVDTTGVVWDTTEATGTYSEDDTCCFFYSDTTFEQIPYAISGEIWEPLHKTTWLPPDSMDVMLGNDTSRVVNNNNWVNLSDEIDTEGGTFSVTYNYGQYNVVYDKVSDFMIYLNYLNSKLGVSENE